MLPWRPVEGKRPPRQSLRTAALSPQMSQPYYKYPQDTPTVTPSTYTLPSHRTEIKATPCDCTTTVRDTPPWYSSSHYNNVHKKWRELHPTIFSFILYEYTNNPAPAPPTTRHPRSKHAIQGLASLTFSKGRVGLIVRLLRVVVTHP